MRGMLRPAAAIGAVLQLALMGTPAAAYTVFSSFGSGYSYDTAAAKSISSAGVVWDFAVEQGNLFRSVYSVDVIQLDLALAHVLGPNTVNVSLWTSALYNPPYGGLGTVPVKDRMLASWTVPAPEAYGTPGPQLVTIGGISGVQLDANTDYWIYAAAVGPSEFNWYDNSIAGLDGKTPLRGWTTGLAGSQEGPLNAFDVVASPLPPAWLLMLSTLGVLGFGSRGWRRRLGGGLCDRMVVD